MVGIKKLRALAMVAAAASALILGCGLAFANGGPHGSYTRFKTAACAACHRAHTARGADLLTTSTIYDLCTTCHEGAGATTDVIDGKDSSTNQRLNGGGFMYIYDPSIDSGVSATSSHSVNGLRIAGDGTSNGLGTAWGGTTGGTGVQGVLECTSCHNPHGSTNYRILKDAVNGDPAMDSSGSPADYRWIPNNADLLDWQNNQVVPTQGFRNTGGYSSGNDTFYTGGMRDFCATCHKTYLTESGSARNPSTNPAYYYYPGTQNANDGKGDIARYRHATSIQYGDGMPSSVRLAASFPTASTRTEITCLTCHFAHGSTAAATGYASGVAPTNDSALLYYDNRGICRECHQQGK